MDGKKLFAQYSDLPRGVYIIALGEMVSALGNLVGPFVTLLLTQTLGFAPEEADGLMTLVLTVAYVPGALLGGRIADGWGRKKTLLASLAGGAACFAGCAFLGNSPAIVWLLGAASFFTAAATPALSSMLTDLTNPANRKAAFSLEYLGRNLGFAFGPLIAGFLFNRYIKWLFLGDALTKLIMAVLIGRYVTETRPERGAIEGSLRHGRTDEKAEEGSFFRVLGKRPALIIFSFILMSYTLILGQNQFSLPIQMNELFGAAGPQLFGSVMTVNGLTAVLLITPITGLTVRNRAVLNVALAGTLLGAGFGMIYYLNSYYLFWVSAVVWTAGEILLATNANVYIADHTPLSHRGRFHAFLPLISGTGAAFGPFLMGQYIGAYGVRPVWPFLGLLAAAATGMMCLLDRAEKKRERGAGRASHDDNGNRVSESNLPG